MNDKFSSIQNAQVKISLSEYFDRVQFVGTRTLEESIKIWTDLTQLVNSSHKKILIEDKMSGVMSTNEVTELIEYISDYKTYKQKSIAIVLKEVSSYNSRFFDVVAERCGVCIKHFKFEKDAIEWLTE